MSLSDSDDSDTNVNKLTQGQIEANMKLVDPYLRIGFRDAISQHQYDRHHRSISRFSDMTPLPAPVLSTNPIVFFDIAIGKEFVGRMIFELREDVVPRAAENFRALCTGEKGLGVLGMPLNYQYTCFHKIISGVGCQGGDLVKRGGTYCQSIYGTIFESENFTLKHEEGTLSMTNYGKPNTNNSQFMITSNPCYNLDGVNVAIGHVLRGLGIIYNEMESVADIDDNPKLQILIKHCGQLMPGENWGFEDNDETYDCLPPQPRDWDEKYLVYTIDEMIKLLSDIQSAGNHFFVQEEYYDARRKYRKAYRYCNFLRSRGEWEEYPQLVLCDENLKKLDEFMVLNYTNVAAVELKLKNYTNAKNSCAEAIFLNKDCSKAYFRRGQAYLALSDVESAVADFGMASRLEPTNNLFRKELIRTTRLQAASKRAEAKKNKKSFN